MEDIAGVKEDITGVKQRLTKVEATMVTKEYLDDKLSDLRGDLTILMRKEDTKLLKLVERPLQNARNENRERFRCSGNL